MIPTLKDARMNAEIEDAISAYADSERDQILKESEIRFSIDGKRIELEHPDWEQPLKSVSTTRLFSDLVDRAWECVDPNDGSPSLLKLAARCERFAKQIRGALKTAQ